MRLQEKIRNTVEKFCSQYPEDREWPKAESFCLDEKPKIKGRFLLWGWGRQSGHNPQNYSWVIYDPQHPDRFQISWKRGNYTSTRDISLVTHEDIDYGFDEFDEPIDSLIRPDFWPEDCSRETNIEEQLERIYFEVLNQLLQGKDVQISFQKNKDRLHVKTVTTKKII